MTKYLKSCYALLLFLFGACNNSPDLEGTQISNPTSNPSLLEKTLTKGELVSKPIEGGTIYLFDFDLPANQYVHVQAQQKGIDFKLSLLFPESDTSVVFDTPNGQRGTEDVYFITDRAGRYKIELQPFSEYAELAGFDIVLKTVREATKEDKAWMNLYEKMRAADRLRKQKETRQKAVDIFKALIIQWEQMGDKYQEAVARRSLGYTLRSLGEKEAAIKTFKSVLPLWKELEAIRYEAFTYLILAGIYKSKADYEKARSLTLKAIKNWREAGDMVQEARAYSDMASFYMMEGNYKKSKKYYDLSIAKAYESGSLSIQGILLREYGNAYQTFGNDEKVLDYYNKAIATYEQMGHLPANALVCRMIGDFLYNKGKKTASKAYFERALKIYQELGIEKMVTSMEDKLKSI